MDNMGEVMYGKPMTRGPAGRQDEDSDPPQVTPERRRFLLTKASEIASEFDKIVRGCNVREHHLLRRMVELLVREA